MMMQCSMEMEQLLQAMGQLHEAFDEKTAGMEFAFVSDEYAELNGWVDALELLQSFGVVRHVHQKQLWVRVAG